MRIRAAALTGVLAGLGLSACAVGPNFEPPKPPSVASYTPNTLPAHTAASSGEGGAAQQFVAGLDVSGRWWTLYRSPALDALVERALRNNPDLQAADAALRAARETYYAQRGVLWPSVSGDYNVVRQKVSATVAPPLASNADLFTLHTAQLNISYTPDVFGGLHRQVESAQAQAEAQRFQTEATYSTLIANLVAAAIEDAMLREQISATRATIKTNADMLAIMRRQFASGEIARSDVTTQAAALAQAEQALPPLDKQHGQQLDLIATLTGRSPADGENEAALASSLSLPTDLPVSLPAKLVEQRPDVRAAEASLHAASAQIGVAIANRLPDITLTASAGGAATELGQLFSHGNSTWSLGADVAQPIFQGGTLLHRQRAAQAAYAQAEAQYRSSVLAAFQNVADTLQALDADARTLASSDRAEREAMAFRDSARRKFDLGEVDRLAVLNADQLLEQAQIVRVQALATRFADTTALFQALGGGWWNRNETQATK